MASGSCREAVLLWLRRSNMGTYDTLSDAVGYSHIHVRAVCNSLRRDGMVEMVAVYHKDNQGNRRRGVAIRIRGDIE